jgi:hypothetical protein
MDHNKLCGILRGIPEEPPKISREEERIWRIVSDQFNYFTPKIKWVNPEDLPGHDKTKGLTQHT